jgi:hypothetical protein
MVYLCVFLAFCLGVAISEKEEKIDSINDYDDYDFDMEKYLEEKEHIEKGM